MEDSGRQKKEGRNQMF